MTVDTIFDCASLTKVIATTSSLMKLFEEGKFRLNDKITDYIPEFQGGKSDITVRDLLTHFSGLRPDLDVPPAWHGYDAGVKIVEVNQLLKQFAQMQKMMRMFKGGGDKKMLRQIEAMKRSDDKS